MKTLVKVLTVVQRIRRAIGKDKRLVKVGMGWHLQDRLKGEIEVHSLDSLVDEFGVLESFEGIDYAG